MRGSDSELLSESHFTQIAGKNRQNARGGMCNSSDQLSGQLSFDKNSLYLCKEYCNRQHLQLVSGKLIFSLVCLYFNLFVTKGRCATLIIKVLFCDNFFRTKHTQMTLHPFNYGTDGQHRCVRTLLKLEKVAANREVTVDVFQMLETNVMLESNLTFLIQVGSRELVQKDQICAHCHKIDHIANSVNDSKVSTGFGHYFFIFTVPLGIHVNGEDFVGPGEKDPKVQ